jgi:hypothetical protein
MGEQSNVYAKKILEGITTFAANGCANLCRFAGSPAC